MINAHAALVHMGTAFDRASARPESNATALQISWPCLPASEVDAKRILAELGINMPTEIVCTGPEDAMQRAGAFKTPVAIKVISADIPHKTDAGGVTLNVSGAQAIAFEISKMQQRLATTASQARIEGYLLSAMVAEGIDCLVALRHDPALGPLIVFGAGGVMAEWLDDISIRLAPISKMEAREMIAQTRISKRLNGWRGEPAADTDSLADAISTLSQLASEHGQVRNLEINPLRVFHAGDGIAALDALVL